MHPIAERIKERFPQALLGESENFGELTLSVRREDILDVCRTLHDDPELSFDHLDWSKVAMISYRDAA